MVAKQRTDGTDSRCRLNLAKIHMVAKLVSCHSCRLPRLNLAKIHMVAKL